MLACRLTAVVFRSGCTRLNVWERFGIAESLITNLTGAIPNWMLYIRYVLLRHHASHPLLRRFLLYHNNPQCNVNTHQSDHQSNNGILPRMIIHYPTQQRTRDDSKRSTGKCITRFLTGILHAKGINNECESYAVNYS